MIKFSSNEVLKIVMIGSGNLASNLSSALYQRKHQIVQVFSRNIDHATMLANQFGAEALTNPDKLKYDADLYIVAVDDKSISTVLNNKKLKTCKIVHTSGSVPLSVFDPDFTDCGVLYPFQTFSKGKLLDFQAIPIFIEANNPEFLAFIKKLAYQLSRDVIEINSDTRRMIHLSGIFACNFVNHMYSIAESLLKEHHIPFYVLNELIKETAAKGLELGPDKAQTGPARRNDQEILKKHLDLLSSRPVYQQLYRLLSEDISLKYR